VTGEACVPLRTQIDGRETQDGRGSFLDFVEKQETATAAVASIEDAADCDERADALVSGLLGRVMRQRRTVAAAMDYIRALSPDTRANAWELARKSGHEGPHRLQALLSRTKWSWRQARGLLPGMAQEVLRDDPDDEIGPGLAIDETADLRKGKSTACASPQHAGVTGRVENCVTWVFTALVTVFGQAWVDFDVYMPDCWAKDPQRREKAGIPEDLAFATKPELAIAQVKRLIAGGLRVLWAAADEVYGRSSDFRSALRGLGLSYVVIVPCDYMVTFTKNKVTRADQAIPEAVFERRSCGNGTKGPRYADWALLATTDPRELLLIRRLPDRGKNQYTYYLCHAAEGRPATLTYFITIAGRRWPVETTFRTGKDAFGWDQSQARTWNAICRHTVLTALAQLRNAAVQSALAGGLVLPAAPEAAPGTARHAGETTVNPADLQIWTGDAPLPATGGQPCPPGIPPIALSHAETGRIARLARDWKDKLLTAACLAFELRWSAWRRRHQARARWHHYSTRLAALAG
jgi:SRSO17 transposase